MTSNVNVTADAIDELYPVAGQDNDSQGFRDNFNYIKTALQVAADEIASLQDNVVLKGDLDGGAAVDNNLGGNEIYNGSYHDFHGTVYSGGSVSGSQDISIADAPMHTYILTADTNFIFREWPGTPSDKQYGVVRVLVTGPIEVPSNDTNVTAAFSTANGGTVYKNLGFPTNFAVSLSKTTSGSQSSGQNQLVLNSATDLSVGMIVRGTGVQSSPATTIANISSNTLTLSQNLSGNITDGTKIHFTYPNGRVIEAWSTDAGSNVFIKHVGDF